jgi:hypothetical protein
MGAAIGSALSDIGHDVWWLPAGRSAETRRRAERAGLQERSSVTGCEVVISICPPEVAVDTARSIGPFAGLYLDANATSPRTATEVARIVRGHGAVYVDGAVIGPPPVVGGTSRLYLSGEHAGDIAKVFAGARLEARVLTSSELAASSLKMTYAAWTKISAALLLAIRGSAGALDVEDALATEWAQTLPELAQRYEEATVSAAAKGWRWAAEMREIAETFLDVGQPDFGTAAANIFSRYPRPVPDPEVHHAHEVR